MAVCRGTNRMGIFDAGIIPNIKEHPRNRKRTKRGRKWWFNAAIHAVRARVERTLAWEDMCQRLLIRVERIQQRHSGMQVLAYALMHLRAFCSTENMQPVKRYGRARENHISPYPTRG
jgi:hypothetical protein